MEGSTLLDRHWRNARTLTSHNPRVYKERIVGDWHLNDAPPVVFGLPRRPEDDAATGTGSSGRTDALTP